MSDEQRICIFSALYAPSTGGVEVFTESLGAKLAKMGYRVIVVTSNTHNSVVKETIDGVEIIRLPCFSLLHGRLPIPKKNAEFKALMQELDSIPMDAVFINTRFYPHSQIAARFAAKKGIKPVLLDHGSAHLTLGKPLVDEALRIYEHFMTHRIKQHDIDYYGISSASVDWLAHFGIEAKGVIANAMDGDTFRDAASTRDFRTELRSPPDSFLVAYTGRLVPEKGVNSLIEAAKLLERQKDIHIILAGDGQLLETAQNAGGNLHALGRLQRGDIAALLLQSNAFCLPTRSEGFSTSLLEATLCECAPIITRVGGVEELIPDDSFGIVIPNADPETVANAVMKLYNDQTTCDEIARNARERGRLFTWDSTAESTMRALKRVAGSEE